MRPRGVLTGHIVNTLEFPRPDGYFSPPIIAGKALEFFNSPYPTATSDTEMHGSVVS